jgi:hypothetical protein
MWPRRTAIKFSLLQSTQIPRHFPSSIQISCGDPVSSPRSGMFSDSLLLLVVAKARAASWGKICLITWVIALSHGLTARTRFKGHFLVSVEKSTSQDPSPTISGLVVLNARSTNGEAWLISVLYQKWHRVRSLDSSSIRSRYRSPGCLECTSFSLQSAMEVVISSWPETFSLVSQSSHSAFFAFCIEKVKGDIISSWIGRRLSDSEKVESPGELHVSVRPDLWWSLLEAGWSPNISVWSRNHITSPESHFRTEFFWARSVPTGKDDGQPYTDDIL